MENTKLISGIIILLFLNAALATPAVLSPTTSNIGLTPGKTGYITISLKNQGTDIAYSTKIVMTSLDSPLKSNNTCNDCIEYSSTQRVCLTYQDYCYLNVGDIASGDTKKASFKVSIPENTPADYYEAKFIVYYESKNATTNVLEKTKTELSEIINITSKTVKPDINIRKTIITPESINPGNEFNITFEIENSGELKARDIKLSLTTTNFKVKGTTNRILTDDMNASEARNITYTLFADASLPTGVYDVGLNASYTDNDNSYSTTSSTGVLIDGKTNFNVFIQDITPDIITPNSDVSVLVSVANTGIITAESVSIKINPDESVTLGNIQESFLGNLDSGGFTTASFNIKPNKEGEIKLNFTVTYTTTTGNKESFSKMDKIIIGYTQAVTSARENPLIQYGGYLIYAAVIIIIAYFFIKAKRKKR